MVKRIKSKALKNFGEISTSDAADVETLKHYYSKVSEILTTSHAKLSGHPISETFADEMLVVAARARAELKNIEQLNGGATQIFQDPRHKSSLTEFRGEFQKLQSSIWAKFKSELRDLEQIYVSVVMPLAMRGERFHGKKHGLSRLSLQVCAMLDSKGAKLPTKLLIRALEMKGVIREENGLLKWEERKGITKTSTKKQFENRVSRLRKRFK